MENYGMYDGPIDRPTEFNAEARDYYGMGGNADVLARVPNLDAATTPPSKPPLSHAPSHAPTGGPTSTVTSGHLGASSSTVTKSISPRLGIAIAAVLLVVGILGFAVGRATAPDTAAVPDAWSPEPPAPDAPVAPIWKGGALNTDAPINNESSPSVVRSLPAPAARTCCPPTQPEFASNQTPSYQNTAGQPYAPPVEPPARNYSDTDHWPAPVTPGVTAQTPTPPVADRFSVERAQAALNGASGAVAQYPDTPYVDPSVRTGANQVMALDGSVPPAPTYGSDNRAPEDWRSQPDQRMAFRPRPNQTPETAPAPYNYNPPQPVQTPSYPPAGWSQQPYQTPNPADASYPPSAPPYSQPNGSQPNGSYLNPAPATYGQPAGTGYNQPAPGMVQPGYGQPAVPYGQPAPGYNPTATYNPGTATYGAPAYGTTGTARFEGVIQNPGVRTTP
ncbi:MAG: hypothetical protein JW818_12610 [Pirellulales bacterium]|nr:hypothetical protein [Pirellulales bacterium]